MQYEQEMAVVDKQALLGICAHSSMFTDVYWDDMIKHINNLINTPSNEPFETQFYKAALALLYAGHDLADSIDVRNANRSID